MYFYVMTRKRWEKLPEDLRPPAEEIIRDCVNFLLVVLYCPDEELQYTVDIERLDQLVKNPGSVNFGDLKCIDVERRGDIYVAHVSEAAPDADGLKRYLEKWLQRWGWSVVVKTEW